MEKLGYQTNKSLSSFQREDYRCMLRFETEEALHSAVNVLAGLAEQKEQARPSRLKSLFDDQSLQSISSEEYMQGFLKKIDLLSSRDTGYVSYRNHLAKEPLLYITVDVDKREGCFDLSLRGAHNNKHEQKIAQETGAPRGYASCKVYRTWETQGDRFSIPLRDIASLYGALGQDFDEQKFVNQFTTERKAKAEPERIVASLSPVTVVSDDHVTAVVSLYGDADPLKYHKEVTEGRDAEYRVENGCLTGPAWYDSEEDGYRAGGIQLDIRPSKLVSVDDVTFNPDVESRIVSMGDAVERVWAYEWLKPAAPVRALGIRR